jgi:hypothetical protein
MTGMAHFQLAGTQPYVPTAIYYEEADSLEYVRRDVPCVYRRVDELLTLVLSMDTREPLGFRIKGFRNFYLRRLKPKYNLRENEFLMLINVVEEAMSSFGDQFFSMGERKAAYEKALNIAEQDDIRLKQLPIAQ